MDMIKRRHFIAMAATLAAGTLIDSGPLNAAGSTKVKVFKSPWCGCCGAWIKHIQSFGFAVDVTEMEDVTPVKRYYGVNPELHSCHTAVFDGYVIEGHVPASDIERLVLERPSARGLAVPGMPIGSPGMEQGAHREPFNVLLFGDKGVAIFSRYHGA